MNQIDSLFTDCTIKRISNAVAAGTSAVTLAGTPVYVGDCDAFQIILLLGAIVAGGTNVFKLQHGDAVGGGDLEDIEGSGVTIADDQDNKILTSEVILPQKLYVNPVLTRGVQNTTVDGILIIKYGQRGARPVTQDATVTSAKQLGSPATGTP
jgi:hypothetical protein